MLYDALQSLSVVEHRKSSIRYLIIDDVLCAWMVILKALGRLRLYEMQQVSY